MQFKLEHQTKEYMQYLCEKFQENNSMNPEISERLGVKRDLSKNFCSFTFSVLLWF